MSRLALKPKPGRRRTVAFALVASGLLVAGVLAFSGIGPGGKSSVHGAAVGPEEYTADAVSRVAALSTIGGVASTTGGVTGALPKGAEADARAALDAAIAQATAALEDAIADAAPPEVPADYVAGVVPDVPLPASKGYLDGSFAASLPTGPVTGALTGVAFSPQASPVGPSQGSLPIEDVLRQVEEAMQTLQDALDQSPVPLGDVVPPLPPLPLGGDAPSQARGAQDAVEPDEQGALLADRHATALLGATSGAYATTSSELAALLAGYQQLADLVEESVELTHAMEAKASADVEALLEERLADIDAQGRTLTAQATRLASEHRKVTGKAHALAESTIQSALDDQLDAIEGARVEALANVTASVASLQRQAASNKADIQALVDAAVAELGSDSSREAVAGVGAIQAAGIAALLKIDREAKAQVEALEASRAGIEAQAAAVQADLTGQAEAAIGGLTGVVEEATDTANEAKAYLLAFAQAQAELAAAREVELAEEAVASLEAAVDAHVEGLLSEGLEATAAADGILETASGLVGEVEDAASTEVGKDLEYIAKVSEDYGRVPTEERKERASHWSTAATEIDGLLGDTLAAGQAVELLAQRAVAAAAQAQAEIESMA